MASLSVRLAKFAPTVGDVTPRAMLRLPADLQTSQWRRRQCGARRLEGAPGGGDFEDGPRMGELWNHWFWVTLALGQIHLLDQVSVQAWDKCFKSQSGSN